MIEANNPNRKTWIEVPENSDFPVQNIPFGVAELPNGVTRCVTRVGDRVIDLYELAVAGALNTPGVDPKVFDHQLLNYFIRLGKEKTRAARNRLAELFDAENAELQDNKSLKEKSFHHIEDVKMRMPVHVPDYTDFYSSIDHATNVGKMFRDPENALLPNWKHLPVGYHGRASSIVVSGTPLVRPKGQTLPADANQPVFGPTKLLDFELEMAFITGKSNPMGTSISTAEAPDYIFGMVIFNDWSARDIQKWEYVPLGPFLAKNFGSSVSPWIVTLDALEPFKVPGPMQEPKVLRYLEYSGNWNFDINLEVFIMPENGEAAKVCNSNYKHMYWNMCQQLAHHTVNGCNISVGDMYASGTISGPDKGSFGSMLEITWRGSEPIKLPDGTERKFINDGDTVIMRGFGEREGVRIGFGEVNTKILPAT